MEHPPICNYEGSDYQTSFWEEGGRDYEDAVEALALQRLLPKKGRLLLELGAGAGRNTPRYQGFEQIVLLDYSTTQLQQARQRLGDSPHLRYVAADIYRLPFVNGLFDCATMIRTLHHMAEPRLALEQVAGTLQKGAAFILEFPNKHNLKAILRYTLGRQHWNPASPEPVEFAALNFDFHPATVRTWLHLSGFALEHQLSVSFLRVGFLKRIVPLKVLVLLEKALQHTSSWWQLTPSVFVQARRLGDPVTVPTGDIFRCPACRIAPLPDTPPEIVCPGCGRIYPVENGIYDFRLQGNNGPEALIS